MLTSSFTFSAFFFSTFILHNMADISSRFASVSNTDAEDRHYKPGLEESLFLSVTKTPVHVRSAQLQGDVATHRRLHGNNLKPNRNKDIMVIRIKHIKGDSADLSYLIKISVVGDGHTILFKMTTAEHYVWDDCMMLQLNGTSHSASLGSRKKWPI